ncbi:hypothetical protein ZIOFF_065977 [Zingiber officinale]|uniref:Uncharacterized protein n=1 Tax=Zingiber officinale TaxID=94328 RepID=A0A8J5K935_ZINOF|nr:hypothetical protein ZIOFF_065977 [Zingiber officinale]
MDFRHRNRVRHCCFGQYRFPAIHGSDDPEAAVNLSGRVSSAATLDLAPRVLFVGDPELRPSSPIYRFPAIHGSEDPEAAVNLSGHVSLAATLDLAPRVLFVSDPELRPSSPIVHCIYL